MIMPDELIANRDVHQDMLVKLGNMLNSAEGDLERFGYNGDVDLTAGHELLSTLRDVHHELGALIADVEADVTAAEDAADESAGE